MHNPQCCSIVYLITGNIHYDVYINLSFWWFICVYKQQLAVVDIVSLFLYGSQCTEYTLWHSYSSFIFYCFVFLIELYYASWTCHFVFFYHNSLQFPKRARGRPHKTTINDDPISPVLVQLPQHIHNQSLSCDLIETLPTMRQRYVAYYFTSVEFIINISSLL